MEIDYKSINQQRLNDLRKEIKRKISSKADRFANSLSKTASEVFVNNAKQRLIKGVVGSNMANVDEVLNNITSTSETESNEYLYTISVKQDSEGLAMFLEYGTGILGSQKPHPEAGEVGWIYKTRIHQGRTYKKHSGSKLVGFEKEGWFFSSKKGTFISKNDEHPVITRNERLHFEHINPKNGTPYLRARRIRSGERVKQNTVFSQGLYPVRYFYKTKEEFKKIFKEIASMSREGYYGSKGEKLKDFENYINRKRL